MDLLGQGRHVLVEKDMLQPRGLAVAVCSFYFGLYLPPPITTAVTVVIAVIYVTVIIFFTIIMMIGFADIVFHVINIAVIASTTVAVAIISVIIIVDINIGISTTTTMMVVIAMMAMTSCNDGKYDDVTATTLMMTITTLTMKTMMHFLLHSILLLSDWGVRPRIETMDLLGQGRHVLVEKDMLQPRGLTLDVQQARLYWVDTAKYSVESVFLKGVDLQRQVCWGGGGHWGMERGRGERERENERESPPLLGGHRQVQRGERLPQGRGPSETGVLGERGIEGMERERRGGGGERMRERESPPLLGGHRQVQRGERLPQGRGPSETGVLAEGGIGPGGMERQTDTERDRQAQRERER